MHNDESGGRFLIIAAEFRAIRSLPLDQQNAACRRLFESKGITWVECHDRIDQITPPSRTEPT